MKQLDNKQLGKATLHLAEKNHPFNRVYLKHGIPPLWDRKPGFATLLYIILEQQVSLASAKAAFEKLQNTLNEIKPDSFLKLSDDELKTVGFSRQKTRYTRILANAILEGTIDLEQLEELTDQEVKKSLMSLTGIGHWTADIYLLMVLLRPDVWPHGDRALAVAAKEVFDLDSVPDYDTLRTMAEQWQPWRSVAARLLWHHYLNTPRNSKVK